MTTAFIKYKYAKQVSKLSDNSTKIHRQSLQYLQILLDYEDNYY